MGSLVSPREAEGPCEHALSTVQAELGPIPHMRALSKARW